MTQAYKKEASHAIIYLKNNKTIFFFYHLERLNDIPCKRNPNYTMIRDSDSSTLKWPLVVPS